MNKLLILTFAIFTAMSMNAQEICTFNADNWMQLDADNGTYLTAGTVIGETASVVAKIGADDTFKPQYVQATVGGQEINGGLQGSANPKDADGGTPSSTLKAPASGAYLQFEAKADGFLYVIFKASSNRAYTVFEEGTPISYTFAAIGDASTLLGDVYQFTLPYEVENEQFVVKNPIEWAEQEYLKSANPDAYAANWKEETADYGTTKMIWNPAIKINGLGVIKFPVYKDCRYIVNANGSKIISCGFVFSAEEDVTIASGGVTIIGEGTAPSNIETWTLAGDKNLLGVDWDITSNKNRMTFWGGEKYSLTINNLTLPKGIYYYKVYKDNSQTESYPSSNASLVIEELATYTVQFIFNTNTKELYATATKTDGLYFNYITKGKVAELIQNPKGYKGTIIIPSTVTHEGAEYTVTKIGDYVFDGCSSLTSVTIPNSVTSIGYSAFSGCSSLTSVTIPNSVKTIDGSAFSSCTGLTSIAIPNGLTSIGGGVFSGCSSLTTITIPNNVTSIGDYAFDGCTGLTTVTIPNSVTYIGWDAFRGCTGLTSITIPNSVISIGGWALSGCSSLSSITIPNGVTFIDQSSFYGCTGLSSITIPNNVTSIDNNAFQNCNNMSSVTIGEKVSNISSGAFANCQQLTDVFCLAGNVPNTASDAFNYSYIEYATLHVPVASLSSYSNSEPWKNFKNIVALEEGDIPVTQKCATPTIKFENGVVKFSCATEGAEFISTITPVGNNTKYDSQIVINNTYKVTVYATKAGYNNSDAATIEIQTNSGVKGDVNADGKVNVADHVELSKIILNQ